MFWKTLIIWIIITFQSYDGSWQRAGTLRNVIWEYKHFLTYPHRKMCNMTQLLKSCEMDFSLERNAVAFRVVVFAQRGIVRKVRCAARGRYIQGCFLVECVGMPPRVWCRTFLPKCMLFGKMSTHCYSVTPGECEISICKNDYEYYHELCLNHSKTGVKRGARAKDFIFCAEHGESPYQLDVAGFLMDYKGPLRPSNTMLFTLTCLVAPFFVKFFWPNLWKNITYALFMKREAKPVQEKPVFKMPCPPVPAFCWRRWLLGWLLRACERLRRASECGGPPLCGAAAPNFPPALLGAPCGPVCAALSPPSPPSPLPAPRGPLFSRNTRIYPPLLAADVEYRTYVDSLFSSRREDVILPFEIEGQDGTSVCLKPIGAVYESREYATVQRLLAGYAACRRGLCADSLLVPPDGGSQRFANLGLDPRRLSLARTYLGNLQDAYNCLQPNPLRRAQIEAASGNSVFVRMFKAQENLRRTLWREIERAIVRAARQRNECACDRGVDETK